MKKVGIAGATFVVLLAAAGWLMRREGDHSPQPREKIVTSIDANLTGLTSKGFAGSVLLENDGEMILNKGYGLADRSTGRLVTPATGFDIGSLAKAFTTMAVLKLETRGRLHRSDSIARFLPNVPADKTPITIQQLLTHTSGLPDIVDAQSNPVEYTPEFDYEPVSRDEIVSRALHATLLFAPGTKSRYSNIGFSVLGAIIEIASGQPYETFLHETIFAAAGMTRTGYTGPAWKNGELAVGYQGEVRWGTPLEHRWLTDGPSWNLRANGGMLSTTVDLAKWIHALEGDTLLTPNEKKAFFGLSVHINRRGARTIGAAGSNEIFDGCFLWYLDEHRMLVMLTSSNKFRAEEMIPELAANLRRIAPAREPRPARKPVTAS